MCSMSSANAWTTQRMAASTSTSQPVTHGGASRPSPWPVLEKVVNPQDQKVRWQRSVVRFPADVQTTLVDNKLLLSGQAGSVKLDLTELDPSGLMAHRLVQTSADGKQASVLLLAGPDKDRFQQVVDTIESNIQGVMQGYLVGLTVQGVGYRLQPVEEPVTADKWFFERVNQEKSNITYPYTKPASAIRIKVGFSRTIIYPLPPDMRAFCVKPNLLYIYGLQYDRVMATAQEIRSLRKPNVYSGNGILLLGEVVKKKQRSSKKGK